MFQTRNGEVLNDLEMNNIFISQVSKSNLDNLELLNDAFTHY